MLDLAELSSLRRPGPVPGGMIEERLAIAGDDGPHADAPQVRTVD